MIGLMKYIYMILKPFSFLPALTIMYLIFSFSSQTGEVSGDLSYRVSYKVVEVAEMVDQVVDLGIEPGNTDYYAEKINYYVRKAAHMTEYFCLAVAVAFPFYVYGLRGFPLLLLAGAICVGFAGLDEYHQSFVEGRGPSLRDVGIDSLGIFFGIMVVRLFCWTTLQMLPKPKKKRRTRQRR